MTLRERRVTIAYADTLSIAHLLQHIYRIDGDKYLSEAGNHKLGEAVLAIENVNLELYKILSEVTDFKREEGKV